MQLPSCTQPLPETYATLAEIAAAHGVDKSSVTRWAKKPGSPIKVGRPNDKAEVDAYVAGFIKPHRRGEQKRQPPLPAIPPAPTPAPPPVPPVASAVPPLDVPTATLEELEKAIRRATNSDVAETLSKQVRALKVVREIQDRDKSRIDSAKARAEIGAALHYFRIAVMGVPRAVAGSLEGLQAAEIEAVLEGRFIELLGELKRGMLRAIGDVDGEPVGRRSRQPDPTGEADAEPMGGEVQDAESPAEFAAGQVG